MNLRSKDSPENIVLSLTKRIQALSQSGLTYSTCEYDLERYEELREISIKLMSMISPFNVEMIRDLFASETGYQTPKVDIRAVVIKENRILMVRERNDGLWSLPGGWADIGVSPGENAKKEVKEETGLDVVPKKVLAILDKECHEHPPSIHHTYKIFILCEIISGKLKTGLETDAVDFFPENNLPELSVNRNTQSQILMMFDLKNSSIMETVFD
ncbi:MAG: NUDIX hydrolase [Acidobacteriota bacterium]